MIKSNIVVAGLMVSSLAIAQGPENPFLHSVTLAEDGGLQGGGGDAKAEIRIKEIRNDILSWIERGGAESLEFQDGLTYELYLNGDPDAGLYGMKDVLLPGAVVVNAIKASEQNFDDDELNTYVDRAPKTCKGFISKKDDRPHLICEVERFFELTEGEQYRQIHHEYASLGRLEKNVGSDSDYTLSSQLAAFLKPTTVLRLAVLPAPAKSKPVDVNCKVVFKKPRYWQMDYYDYALTDPVGPKKVPLELMRKLIDSGYEVVKHESDAGIVARAWTMTLFRGRGVESGVTLQHKQSGFTGVYHGEQIPRRLDPRKVKLQEELAAAKTVAEHQRILQELKTGVFHDRPAVHEFTNIDIPRCESFFGR